MWRLLRSDSTDAGLNLALEEALVRLLERSGYSGVLVLWRNSPSVVLGRLQRAREEVDLEYCSREGIGIYRRLSGGGAVYHDLGVLNFTVVAEARAHPELRDVERAYAAVARPLVRLLRQRYGIEAEYSEGIFVGERKVAGLAQYRYYDAVLVHGSVLLDADLAKLSRSLLRKKHPVAILSELSSRELVDFEEELPSAFEEELGIALVESEVSDEERELAAKLRDTKYSNPLYNLGGRRPRIVVDVYLCKSPSGECLVFDERVWLRALELSSQASVVVRRHYVEGLSRAYALVDGAPLSL